jgi:hypothetical protein
MGSIRTLIARPLHTFSKAGFIMALIIRILLIVGGIGFIYLAFNNLYFGEMSSWREVNATITGNDSHMQNPTLYTPNFSYQIDGETYTDTGTQASENKYKIGDTISILVNPEDPTNIYQRNSRGQSRFMTSIAILVLILPFIFIMFRTVKELIIINSNSHKTNKS